MSLCAQDNMTVAMPSTPGSYFHLVGWQVLSDRIKPLVVLTPKSLLRLKTAVSAVTDFTSGWFRPVLTDPGVADPARVRRVLLCSGKIYYDLAERSRTRQCDGAAIGRVERLDPLPVPGSAAALPTEDEPTCRCLGS